jgi:hypothetical protein
MAGQHYDEMTLGYERRVSEHIRLGVRGIYRTQREAIEDAVDCDTGEYRLGNPGEGKLGCVPHVKREYNALEVTLRYAPQGCPGLLASYVLSRNYGNYTGLYNSDLDLDLVNSSPSLDNALSLRNATGLLPNDRTHVVKFAGAHPVGQGFTAGASLVWQSGTPLSEFGAVEPGGLPHRHISKRGTAGRTPSIWDLNLRLQYDLHAGRAGQESRIHPRFLVDLLHLGSQRKAVDYDQRHFFGMDAEGSLIDPNPTYGRATKYQPPMAIRLGLEVDF